MGDQQILIKLKETKIDVKFLQTKFDPITVVVDTLLSQTPLKVSFSQLQQLNAFLDSSIKLLATERTGLFNNLLYAYQPI